MKALKRVYGSKYMIYVDGAYYDQTWCRWLRTKHYVYDNEDKNIIKRYVQYINKG